MLGFDKFFENKTLMISAGAVAFLAAALLILFIIRLAFYRRLHMPGGGRARQPRLGVVDAFDLDRQRQLVIVRRDNVEHLVMIGGPNDLLIESQIVRVEARETPRPRDKEPTVAPLAWPGGTAVPAPGQPPSIAPEPKHLPVQEAPVLVAAREGLPPTAPPSVAPPSVAPPSTPPPAPASAPPPVASVLVPSAPPQGPGSASPAAPSGRPPFLPLPPRRTTPLPPLGGRPPPSVGTAPGGTVENPSSEGGATPVGPAPRASNAPPPLPRPTRPLSTPTFPSSPPVPPVASSPIAPAALPLAIPLPPRPAEAAPPPRPPVPEAVPAPKPVTEPERQSTDAIESLEEEMAKLLGRDTQRS